MNTTLASARSLDRVEQDVRTDAAARRISAVDRMSLRLGLWLLLRGTRHLRRAHDHAAHETARAEQRARHARNRADVEHLMRGFRA